jgi:general secretion pathway protein H
VPRILETGTCNKPQLLTRNCRCTTGFTLLEILLVVLIIGIVSSLLVMSTSTSGSSRKLQQEAERLVALLQYARQQAILENRLYGLQLQHRGYQFMVYQNRNWQVAEQTTMRLRQLPQQGRIYLLGPVPVDPQQPAVMFSPLGEQDDFQLRLSLRDYHWRVTGQPDGRLTSEQEFHE